MGFLEDLDRHEEWAGAKAWVAGEDTGLRYFRLLCEAGLSETESGNLAVHLVSQYDDSRLAEEFLDEILSVIWGRGK